MITKPSEWKNYLGFSSWGGDEPLVQLQQQVSLSAMALDVWLVYVPLDSQGIRALFKTAIYKNAANLNLIENIFT